jgi:hypothetical protein
VYAEWKELLKEELGLKERLERLYPLCREPHGDNDGKKLERTKELMEEGNPYVVGFGAQCHFNGEKGFSKDIPRAIELFNKAGELGHEMSYYNLGQIYRNGQGGVDVDLKKENLTMKNLPSWDRLMRGICLVQ